MIEHLQMGQCPIRLPPLLPPPIPRMVEGDHMSEQAGAFGPAEFGELRDILVFDTDLRDWQRVLDYVRTLPRAGSFTLDADPAALPDSASAIFALREQAVTSLGIDVADVAVIAHFFDPSEIELDFDPRDVKTEDQRAALLAFMQALADLLDKPVFVAPEGSHAEILHRVAPVSHAVA